MFFSNGRLRKRLDSGRFHIRQEPVASLRKCLDETGILGVITQCFAQAVDGFVEPAVKIDHDAGRPEALLQLLTSDDLARVLDQSHENLKGLFLELDPDAPLPQFSGNQVDLENSEPDGRRRSAGANLSHR
jgi:hypothetical protein